MLAIYRRHPLVLPCPVHGPVSAKPQWIHVILVLFSSCLASPKDPPWRDIDIAGWQKGHLPFLAAGHAQRWRVEVQSRERTTALSVWSLTQGYRLRCFSFYACFILFHTCMHILLHRPTVGGIWLTVFDELFIKLCHAWTSGRLAVTDTLTSHCAVFKDGLSSREHSNTTRLCWRWYDLPHWRSCRSVKNTEVLSALFPARLCCAFWVEMTTTRLVIYLHRW